MKPYVYTSLLSSLCIQFIIIHSLQVSSSLQSEQQEQEQQHPHDSTGHRQQQPIYENAAATTTTDATSTDVEVATLTQSLEISDEDKKIYLEHFKANFLKVLGLKEAPKKPVNKAYVPRAMLEEYIKSRDLVRETIPDDRDFYGKINVADLETENHEDYWNKVYNKYGTYEIEVDMDRNVPSSESYHVAKYGEMEAAYFSAQDDPQNLSPHEDSILPPYNRKKGQSYSVLLRFNLSQELYIRPIGPDDLRKAEIHLTREKLSSCDFVHCDTPNAPIQSDHLQPQEASTLDPNLQHITPKTHATSHTKTPPKEQTTGPRFLRVNLFQVNGKDTHNDFLTRLHMSKRIDTSESDSLVFDIHDIVLDWLKDSTSNHGLIVKVATEEDYDPYFKREVNQESALTAYDTSDNTTLSSNASTTSDEALFSIEDHVRLKREFRSASEADYFWHRHRPTIMIQFSQPSDPSRRHVKRDHSATDVEGTSNEPSGPATDNLSSTSKSTSTERTTANPSKPSVITSSFSTTQPRPDTQNNDDRQVQANKSKNSSSSTLASNRVKHSATPNTQVYNKRERQGNTSGQYARNSPGRASSIPSQNGQKGRAKHRSSKANDKCSKHLLSINFDEVGWSSWIIAPQAYFANYCFGDCTPPLADNANATNHAIIQSIFNKVSEVIPRACCAPTKLGRMAILYQLDGGVQMRHYDDMIVESCGCL